MLINKKYNIKRLYNISEGTRARAINIMTMIKVKGGDYYSFIKFYNKGYPLLGSPSTFSH